MAFADWVKRSDLAATALSRYQSLRSVLQAAYKAGERHGRKDAEDLAQRAVSLAVALEREECARACDAFAYEWRGANSQIVECASKIRKRSNAEVRGD